MRKLLMGILLLAVLTVRAEVHTAEIGFAGYTGRETLANFPALIKLPDAVDGFTYAEAGNQGEQMWFTDANGNVLAHEVDHWDAEGKSYVWVKVPTLTAATKINIHWGAAAPAEKPAATAVWTGYTGVWHMNAADGATSTVEPDVTGNGLDATPVRRPTGNGREENVGVVPFGKVGNCVQNQQSSVTRNSLVVPAYWDKMSNVSVMTIGGWVRMGRGNGWSRMFSAKQRNDNNTGWEIFTDNGSTTRFAASGSAAHNGANMGEVVELKSKWTHVQFVFNGDSVHLYANGRFYRTMKITAVKARTDGSGFVMGCNLEHDTTKEPGWCGFFDEIRLYDGVLSADRIKAEYDTSRDPVGFIKGSSVARSADVYTAGYSGSETLTDLPVQVVFPDTVPGFDFNDASSDGSDIWFSDADGNPLPFERDGWKLSKDSGRGVFWVKVPQVTRTTKFTVHWGGTPPADLPAATNTWNGYVGVWHMGSAKGNPVTNEPDATGHGLDAVPNSSNSAKLGEILTRHTGGESLLGDCTQIQSEGGKLNGLQVPNYSNFIKDHSRFTIEGWFYADKGNSYSRLFSAQTSNQQGVGWEVWHNNSLASLGMSGSRVNLMVGTQNFAQKWIHVLVVYDGGTARMYYNGRLINSGGITAVVARSDNYGFTIGGNANFSDYSLYGCVDEIRMYNGVVSADRALAEYLTQAKPGQFLRPTPGTSGAIHEELPTYGNRFNEQRICRTTGGVGAYVWLGYGLEFPNWGAGQNYFQVASPNGGAMSTANWGPYGSITLGDGDWTLHSRIQSVDLPNGALWGLGETKGDNTGLVLMTDGTNGVALVTASNVQPVEGSRVSMAVENCNGAYHDYGVVFHAATKQLDCYVDGVWQGTLAHPNYNANSGCWVLFGVNGGAGTFAGPEGARIEDIRFYRRALTVPELTGLHQWLSGDLAVCNHYTATVTRDMAFHELVWTPTPPSGGFSADDMLTVTFEAPGKSLYMWDIPRVQRLSVRGCEGAAPGAAGRILEVNSYGVWPRGLSLEDGAEYDAYGHGNRSWFESPHVTLADGTAMRNTQLDITDTRSAQANGLALARGSTAYVGDDLQLGLIGYDYARYWVDLNAGRLVKRGSADFWVANATMFGPGIFEVFEGKVILFKTGFRTRNAEVSVKSGATLAVQIASTIDRLSGAGNVTVTSGNVLTVKELMSGLLTVAETANSTNAVTLVSGAAMDFSANTEPFVQPTSMMFAGEVKVVPPGRQMYYGRKQLIAWDQPPTDEAVRFECVETPHPVRLSVESNGLWIDMSGTMIYIR